MSYKLYHQCGHPGCQRITNERYCAKHKKPAWAEKKDVGRVTGRKLQRQRNLLFHEQPLCVECLRVGRVTAATRRDHIVPLAEGGEDVAENTQVLCTQCHDRKSEEERKRGRHGRN